MTELLRFHGHFFVFCIINAMRLIGNLCCFISVNFEYQLVKSIHPKSFGVRPFLAFLGISKCFHQLWSGYSKYTPSIEPTKCDSRSENIESTSALALFTLLISFSCCFNIFKANTWIELLMVYLSTRHCFRRDKIPFQFAVVFGFFSRLLWNVSPCSARSKVYFIIECFLCISVDFTIWATMKHSERLQPNFAWYAQANDK